MKYIALLRGINVGGNAKVPMVDLKACFESLNYENVKTYINSGNVIFESNSADRIKLRREIEIYLKKKFELNLSIVLVEAGEYKKILKSAPAWWGNDPVWRHNLIFMLEPYDMKKVVEEIGELKPSIEYMQAGEGFIFQSNLKEKASRTRFSRITGTSVYKQMTIRNHNTARKLGELLK